VLAIVLIKPIEHLLYVPSMWCFKSILWLTLQSGISSPAHASEVYWPLQCNPWYRPSVWVCCPSHPDWIYTSFHTQSATAEF